MREIQLGPAGLTMGNQPTLFLLLHQCASSCRPLSLCFRNVCIRMHLNYGWMVLVQATGSCSVLVLGQALLTELEHSQLNLGSADYSSAGQQTQPRPKWLLF